MSEPAPEPSSPTETPPLSRWGEALLAAALFAVDPPGTGIALRARAGPARDAWLAHLQSLLAAGEAWRRLPAHISDDRLLGGLDLAATLRQGRPVAERGLLAEAHGGVVVVPMAERLSPSTAAHLAMVLDQGEVVLEREGLAQRAAATIGLVTLDEGVEEDERLPAALADRLALVVDLETVTWRESEQLPAVTAADVREARARLGRIAVPDDLPQALCVAALALGIPALRAPLHALKVARAAAALLGLDVVDAEAAQIAARLVLAPRATMIPSDEAPEDEQPEPPPEEPPDDEAADQRPKAEQPLEDVVLEAAKAALPEGLLAALAAGLAARGPSGSQGHAGALAPTTKRGRPIGARPGEPAPGVRLNVVETLRAAAPWQALRRLEAARQPQRSQARVQVRREDFRITRFKQRNESVAIFVVDASGSAALHRLAEAKGAVELLLADCYVRRDHVALIAFRNREAELLLPPTRSLTRAKNSVLRLPGGGGTPLAAGLEAASVLAQAVRRRGQTPALVVMTDGRANVARDGTPGRPQANADALAAAALLRSADLSTLVVDVSPRPDPKARALAEAMGGAYLPLPSADAATLNAAVRAQTGA